MASIDRLDLIIELGSQRRDPNLGEIMKYIKLLTLLLFVVFSIGIHAQSGVTNEFKAPEVSAVGEELGKYVFPEDEYLKNTTDEGKKNFCDKFVSYLEGKIGKGNAKIGWDTTEKDCICKSGEDRTISCEKEKYSQYGESFLAGDMSVDSVGGQCVDSKTFPVAEGAFSYNDVQGKASCNRSTLYSVAPIITNDEVGFIAEGAAGISEDDIHQDPLVSCKKVYGSSKFTFDSGLSAPSGDYICAQAERSLHCSGWTSLYSAISNLGTSREDGANGIFFSIAEKILAEIDSRRSNNFIDAENIGESLDNSRRLTKENNNLKALNSIVFKWKKMTTNSSENQEAVPVFEIDFTSGAKIVFSTCPDTVKEFVSGGSDVSAATIADQCKQEFLATVMGTKDARYGVQNVDPSEESNLYTISNQKIISGEEHYNPLKRCRNQVAVAVIQNKVIPCRAFQSVAYTFNEYNHDEEKYSTYDQKITCKKDGMFTADFKFCKRLVDTYNASSVAENTGKIAENVSVGQANVKAAQMMAEDPNNVQDKSLEGAEMIADRKILHEKIKVGMYSANAALYAGFVMSWPTPKNLGKRCAKNGGGITARACCTYASAKYFSTIFKNYEMKRRFTHELFYALGKAGAAGVMWSLYKKQKDALGDAREELAELEPEDYNGLSPDMLTNLCQADPNAPGCRAGRNLVNQGAVGQGNINFNGAGGAQMGAASPSENFQFDFDEGGAANLSDEDRNAISETIAGGKSGRGGFEDNVAAAQKVARTPGEGGGGGGGSAGKASAPGLSGAAKQGGDPKSKMVTDSGGRGNSKGSGGFAYTGGGYRYAGGKKGDKNPFSGLFGKKGSKGGVSVRGVASKEIGDKSFGIFDKISRKYSEVNKAKRLIEYEVE